MATGKRIKGITIEIGGDTVGLEKALKDVNQQSNALKGELRDVERLLKFDPGNAEAAAQKQKLLADQIKVTSDRLEYLKNAQQQVDQQFANGKINEQQYRNFRREIEFTEGSLKNLEQNLSALQSEQRETVQSTNKLEKSFKDAGQEAKDFGRSVADGIGKAGAVGAVAVGGLVTGMQEYNQDLARLKTNASTAGRDLEAVEKAFMRITEVTGETDSAVETVSNLLASGFEDNQLEEVINQVNGAAIKFSDTLKTEGIADGIQETFATGKAIGPFAELLERSGINLDTFNAGLAEAQKKGEGANFILQTLSEQGFGSIYQKYQELNPEVQKNAEANANLQKSLADLALVLTPLVEQVTSFITKVVEWGAANPELTSTITAVGISIGLLTGLVMVLAPAFTALTAASAALNIGLLPLIGISAAVAVGIVALIAVGVLLYKNWDEIKAKASEIWGSIKTFLINLWNTLESNAKEIFNKMKSGLETVMNGLSQFFSGIWTAIKNIFLGAVLLIVDLVTGDFEGLKRDAESIFNNLKGALGNIWNGIKTVISGVLDVMKSLFSDKFESMKNAASDKMEAAQDKIVEIWEGVVEFFNDIDLMEIGKNIMQGLVEGIDSMKDAIWKKVKDIADSIKKTLKEALEIFSPSRATTYLGEMVGAGLVKGMDNSLSAIKSMSMEMAGAALPNMPNMKRISNPGTSNSYGNVYVTIQADELEKIPNVIRFFDELGMKVTQYGG